MTLWIITPSFFDVPSFRKVRENALRALNASPELAELTPRFVLIDDTAGQDDEVGQVATTLPEVHVITPPYNLGHQGALVFALRTLSPLVEPADYVVTMDADGEDRPDDIPALLSALLERAANLHQVSVAMRTRRKETLLFKLLYLAFKSLFRVLTGTVVRNGNFVAYRGWILKEVIFHPHFDQCYSSSFMSLPLQVARVPIARGARYFGRSRMGLLELFTHGMRMLLPFTERITTRGLIFGGLLFLLSLAGMVAGLGRQLAGSILSGPWLVLVVASALGFVLSSVSIGVCLTLFAAFSQNKSRSLRGLQPFQNRRTTEPAAVPSPGNASPSPASPSFCGKRDQQHEAPKVPSRQPVGESLAGLP